MKEMVTVVASALLSRDKSVGTKAEVEGAESKYREAAEKYFRGMKEPASTSEKNVMVRKAVEYLCEAFGLPRHENPYV